MKSEMNIKLPTHYAAVGLDESAALSGGAAVDTAVKAVLAVGGAGVLLCAAAIAATGILGIIGEDEDSLIGSAIGSGQRFIDNALSAGQSFLDSLMGR